MKTAKLGHYRDSNMNKNLKSFFDYIRSQPCCYEGCHGGMWSMDKGIWNNTVSHVLKRGSTRRNEHFGNVVSMCFNHHQQFEVESPEHRLRFKSLAERMVSEFEFTRG